MKSAEEYKAQFEPEIDLIKEIIWMKADWR